MKLDVWTDRNDIFYFISGENAIISFLVVFFLCFSFVNTTKVTAE